MENLHRKLFISFIFSLPAGPISRRTDLKFTSQIIAVTFYDFIGTNRRSFGRLLRPSAHASRSARTRSCAAVDPSSKTGARWHRRNVRADPIAARLLCLDILTGGFIAPKFKRHHRAIYNTWISGYPEPHEIRCHIFLRSGNWRPRIALQPTEYPLAVVRPRWCYRPKNMGACAHLSRRSSHFCAERVSVRTGMQFPLSRFAYGASIDKRY